MRVDARFLEGFHLFFDLADVAGRNHRQLVHIFVGQRAHGRFEAAFLKRFVDRVDFFFEAHAAQHVAVMIGDIVEGQHLAQLGARRILVRD